MTIILKCPCENEFQDKRYGLNMRVHNTLKKDNQARCTVCKSVKSY